MEELSEGQGVKIRERKERDRESRVKRRESKERDRIKEMDRESMGR